MPLHVALEENLRFLVIEVQKQVARSRAYLSDPTGRSSRSIAGRDDYIDNLKTIIQRRCFSLAAESSEEGGTPLDVLKAVDIIAVNLEHIADYCENIIAQTKYLRTLDPLERQNFAPFFEEVLSGLDQICDAVLDLDLKVATRICRVEPETDRLYKKRLGALLKEIQSGGNASDLVTLIFIYRYLERMGDALLNIGEAVMSACLGERVKIGQFEALEDSLASAGAVPADVSLHTMAETRSGCKIDRVDMSQTPIAEKAVIFKEGSAKKVEAERDGIEAWHKIAPGLAPRIHAFNHDHDHSSILLEYLDGWTFDKYLLNGTEEELDSALSRLCKTLDDIWSKTREDGPVAANFVQQMKDRMNEVYSVHPEFRSESSSIGSLEIASFDRLIDRASEFESGLSAPFSVFIHGDFNVDNIIFDRASDDLHFIDLHRSRRTDYLQDVSVFLVSNFRLRVPRDNTRKRIKKVTLAFYEFAKGFAERQGDKTFQLRLALGIARSMATSSRFILDSHFARTLYLRSRYMLELIGHADPAHPEKFEIPTDALVD